jgi:acyl dehydratase
MTEIFLIDNLAMGINYGLDKVRFPSPVPAGSRIRAGATLNDIRESHLGTLSYVRVIIEVDGQERAACVADTLSLYVPASGGDTAA